MIISWIRLDIYISKLNAMTIRVIPHGNFSNFILSRAEAAIRMAWSWCSLGLSMNFPLSRVVRIFAYTQIMKLYFALPVVICISANSSAQSSHADLLNTNQNSNQIASVIIGSRFSSVPGDVPLGSIVISENDIRNAGIDDVNEAVRKLAGVYGRQNFSGSTDFSLDISGFGADSANNLVILVDGVRLSESEQATALLSSIPIDSVARIEIMRGGSSVLYGDGATGGVIQVITKQAGMSSLRGSITGELGQFNDRSARVWLTKGWDQSNLSLNVSDKKSDSYRDNNWLAQQNISAVFTQYFDWGRTGLRLDSAHQKSGFPGALTLAQFQKNPRQTFNPNDEGSIQLNRITAFWESNWRNWQAAAELSTRDRTTQSDFVSMQALSTYSGRQTQFSPRLLNTTQTGKLQNELVMGLDLMNWNRQTDSNFSLAYATQRSKAVYFRDEMKIDQMRFAVGVRRELFDKMSADPLPGVPDNYAVTQGVNAWEMQGSYAFTPVANVFAKLGQSYRVANVDDNAFTAQPNIPLLPQLSHDLELGAVMGADHRQFTLRFFQHRITNEIYFDPTANNGLGANSNLDPTKRQGVAVDIKFRLSPEFHFSAQAQHVTALFTEESHAGSQLALVPKNTVFARLNWMSGDGQQAYLAVQWVDKQRYGGDFTNACPGLIPAYSSVDGRYAHTIGSWEWAVSGVNLTDKRYFTSAFACMSGIYPDAGRQIKTSLRYVF